MTKTKIFKKKPLFSEMPHNDNACHKFSALYTPLMHMHKVKRKSIDHKQTEKKNQNVL